MGFNASLGNPTWCLGEFAYVHNESLAFAARVRSGGVGRQELCVTSCFPRLWVLLGLALFAGMDTQVFPLGCGVVAVPPAPATRLQPCSGMRLL